MYAALSSSYFSTAYERVMHLYGSDDNKLSKVILDAQDDVPELLKVKVAIIGGSGLYELPGLTDKIEVEVDTAYGKPSDVINIGKLDGVGNVAFLARHGSGHVLNPSEINYRANILALKKLGAKWILAVSACGSLKEEIAPGNLVLIDQFIDRTVQRSATFYCNGIAAHVPFSDPICSVAKACVAEACEELELKVHAAGTYVNIEGPSFSTRAESEMHRSWGAHVVGMTNMTEARLAREAEISMATIAMATDYDAWRPDHEGVTVEEVVKTVAANAETAKKVILAALPKIVAYNGPTPPAQKALAGGRAILTKKEKIPDGLLIDLEPILGAYVGPQKMEIIADDEGLMTGGCVGRTP